MTFHTTKITLFPIKEFPPTWEDIFKDYPNAWEILCERDEKEYEEFKKLRLKYWEDIYKFDKGLSSFPLNYTTYMKALSVNPFILEFIPEESRDEKMYLKALKQNKLVKYCIDKWSPKLFLTLN